MSNSKTLRTTGIIEIILGAVSLVSTHVIIGKGDASVAGISMSDAMLALVAAYALAIFQIIAGIVAILNAEKKSILAFIFGILLFIPQLYHFFSIKGSIPLIIVNIVALAIPYFYMSSAYKNMKEK